MYSGTKPVRPTAPASGWVVTSSASFEAWNGGRFRGAFWHSHSTSEVAGQVTIQQLTLNRHTRLPLSFLLVKYVCRSIPTLHDIQQSSNSSSTALTGRARSARLCPPRAFSRHVPHFASLSQLLHVLSTKGVEVPLRPTIQRPTRLVFGELLYVRTI